MNTYAVREAEFKRALALLVQSIHDKAVAQFEYNETVNLPENIVKAEDSVELALQVGVAAGVNLVGEWDTENAVRYASAILEDANCHSENAALLREAGLQ